MTDDEILAAAERIGSRRLLKAVLRDDMSFKMRVERLCALSALTEEDSRDIALFLADRYEIDLK